jgi:hypothetical protein
MKVVNIFPDYKYASAATSYRHGLPVSRLHGCNVYKPSLEPGFRHKSVWNRFALTRRASGRIA